MFSALDGEVHQQRHSLTGVDGQWRSVDADVGWTEQGEGEHGAGGYPVFVTPREYRRSRNAVVTRETVGLRRASALTAAGRGGK